MRNSMPPRVFHVTTIPRQVRFLLVRNSPLNSALTLPEPTNFIQVVLKGVSNKEGALGLVMPAYASSLSNADRSEVGGLPASHSHQTLTLDRLGEESSSGPTRAGGVALRERRRFHDRIQSQWTNRFGAQ